jgi:hypothetical protein
MNPSTDFTFNISRHSVPALNSWQMYSMVSVCSLYSKYSTEHFTAKSTYLRHDVAVHIDIADAPLSRPLPGTMYHVHISLFIQLRTQIWNKLKSTVVNFRLQKRRIQMILVNHTLLTLQNAAAERVQTLRSHHWFARAKIQNWTMYVFEKHKSPNARWNKSQSCCCVRMIDVIIEAVSLL